MNTYSIKQSEIKKNWLIVDADGKTLGRFASKIAQLLKGKHKPTYTPHMDMGDCVVVVNAEKIILSGSKKKIKLILVIQVILELHLLLEYHMYANITLNEF